MSKKKKKEKETNIEDFYDLRTKEVDELVSILKGEASEPEEPVSYDIAECIGEEAANQGEVTEYRTKQKKFDPYKRDFLSRIPCWIKALFIKWWFFGLVCYFVIMGLGMYIENDLDRLVLAGAIMGILTDIMVNPAFHYMETSDKEYDNFMMFPFPFKKFWTFFTNIIYYIGVGLVVMLIYSGINQLFAKYEGYISLGVEPLLYGTFVLIVDMACIGVKDLIVFLVRRGKRKRAEAKALAAEISGGNEQLTEKPQDTATVDGQPANGEKEGKSKAKKKNKSDTAVSREDKNV